VKPVELLVVSKPENTGGGGRRTPGGFGFAGSRKTRGEGGGLYPMVLLLIRVGQRQWEVPQPRREELRFP
jgi:hypothetical protein